MACQKELTDWILSHAEALDLRVQKLTWIEEFFDDGWFDLDVSMQIDGKRYSGRGAAKDDDTALAKGFCEAVERFICTTKKISSTGVAGHFDSVCAKANAELELIERIAVANHFGKRIPFERVYNETVTVALLGGRSANLNVHIVKMVAPSNFSAILCLAEGVTTGEAIGGIVGLGCGLDQTVAITKARVECLRNVTALRAEPLDAITKLEFDKIMKPTARDSQRLLLDTSYCQNLMDGLIKGEPSKSTSCDFPDFHANFEKLEIADQIFQNCPLTFFRSTNALSSSAVDLEWVG